MDIIIIVDGVGGRFASWMDSGYTQCLTPVSFIAFLVCWDAGGDIQ